MKKVNYLLDFKFIYLLCAIGLMPFRVYAQDVQPMHFGIFYPLSTQGTASPQLTNTFSLHAFSGISGGEKGLAIYGLAGIINGNASGLQVAGLYNLTKGTLNGIQISGLMNQASTADSGLQIAGLINHASGYTPFQVAGLYNKTTRIKGLQAAGLVNLSEESEGVQTAGLVNVSERVSGIQMGGLVNLATDVQGMQVSGLVNRARVVRGVQLAGLINIADSSDYPIAIINIIKSGKQRLGVTIDENHSLMLGFRSGGSKVYGLIGLGTNLQNSRMAYGFETGLGISLLQSKAFNMDLEAGSLFMTDFEGSRFYRSGVRLLPAINIGRNVQLFGGPSLNLIHSNHQLPTNGLDFWSSKRWEYDHALQLGYTIGIQFYL
jgi:hypothetical protein